MVGLRGCRLRAQNNFQTIYTRPAKGRLLLQRLATLTIPFPTQPDGRYKGYIGLIALYLPYPPRLARFGGQPIPTLPSDECPNDTIPPCLDIQILQM